MRFIFYTAGMLASLSFFGFACLAAQVAAGQQQPDPVKTIPFLKQQREAAFDNIAACSVLVTEQQAKIAELEKQLAEAKAAPK